MNSRRSKSVKLVSSNSMSIEVELSEGSAMGFANNTIYCCVAKGHKILYSYSSKEKDLERLAVLCLENAPLHHSWYFQTVGTRTYGFLMADGYTYFAIVDPTVGNVGTLWFLEQVRDGFKKVTNSGYHEQLVPVIRRLIESLEKMPQSVTLMDDSNSETVNGEASSSTKAPLLGKNSGRHHDKRKTRERASGANKETEEQCDRVIDVLSEETMEPAALQRSSSTTRILGHQISRRVWWHYVKIIVIVDVIICLVFFSIWLAVCRGFSCIS